MLVEKKSGGSAAIWIKRTLRFAPLVIATIALVLVLKKPAPVAPPLTATAVSTNAESFQQKIDHLAQAQRDGQSGTEVHLSGTEIAAAIAQASSGTQATTTTSTDPNAAIAAGSIDPSSIQQQNITFEGDLVKGQFAAEVGGKKVYVTVAGHIGSKDGYATFDPTEFKIGDLNIPVSLVNDALQKKLQEQKDRMKLPDYVSDLRVENGELVAKQK